MTNQEILQIQAEDFKASVLNELRERPISETAPEKVRALTLVSYAPNIVSLATGSFFIFYLTGGYPFGIKLGLIILLTLVLTALEYVKRNQLGTAYKKAYMGAGKPYFAVFILCLVYSISMLTSYEGGRRLVLENSTPPTLSANSAISTLENKLATIRESITKQQNTTWKGVITVDANRNLKKLYPIQSNLEAEIAELRAEDRSLQSKSDAKHNSKTLNFGYVLGSIAILADLVLLLLFSSIYRTKAYYFKSLSKRAYPTQINKTPDNTGTPGGSPQNGVKNVLNGFNSSEVLDLAIKGARVQASAYRKRKTAHSKNTVDRLENFIANAQEAVPG